jgi:serine/threonine protein kinase
MKGSINSPSSQTIVNGLYSLNEELYEHSNKINFDVNKYEEGAFKYYEYIDLCIDFLDIALDVVIQTYKTDSVYSPEVKHRIKTYKRIGGIEGKKEDKKNIIDKLQNINPLIYNSFIPNLYEKYLILKPKNLPRKKLLHLILKKIQVENECVYSDIEEGIKKENEGVAEDKKIKRPQDIGPIIFNSRTYPNLFKKHTSGTSKSEPGKAISYEIIKADFKQHSGKLKKIELEGLSNKLEALNQFYDKLVPWNMVLTTVLFNRSYEKSIEQSDVENRNLISITDDIFEAYCEKTKNKKQWYEFNLKELFAEIKTSNQYFFFTIKNRLYTRYFALFVASVINAKQDALKLGKTEELYINYIGQLCAFNKTRAESTCIPVSIGFFEGRDEEFGIVEAKIFFRQTWGECIELVFSKLFNTSTSKRDYINTFFEEVFNNYSISRNDFFVELREKIKEIIVKQDSTEEQEIENRTIIYIEELLNLSDGFSPQNIKRSALDEMIARTTLRLIILYADKRLPKDKDSIFRSFETALKFEIACLSQEFFSGRFLNDQVADYKHEDLHSRVPHNWRVYQEDSISSFAIWFIFLLDKEVLTTSNVSLSETIDEAFNHYISHQKRPVSPRSFVFKKGDEQTDFGQEKQDRDSLVPYELYGLDKDDINNAALSIYTNKYKKINTTKTVFQMSQSEESLKGTNVKTAEQILKDNNICSATFFKLINADRLIEKWNEYFSIEGNEVLTYSYWKYLLEDCFGSSNDNEQGNEKDNKKENSIVYKSIKEQEKERVAANKKLNKEKRSYLKNKLNKINSDSHFGTYKPSTFTKLTFSYSPIFEENLRNKNNLLSKIESFKHDRFVINRKVGQGDFSVVYHAKDIIFNSDVVIKLIPHWIRSKDVSNKLVQEAIIMRNCQHPNIVIVYDLIKLKPTNFKFNGLNDNQRNKVFDDNEFVYGLVMEHIDGFTLNHFLEKKNDQEYCTFGQLGKLAVKDKLDLFIDICEGVKRIHELGGVHGDLKPENILIYCDENESFCAKITDFGLSGEANEDSHSSINHTFSSVSMLTGGNLSQQDDLYSLGMLFIYMFFNDIESYFKDKSLIELYYLKSDLFLTLKSLYINFSGYCDEDLEHMHGERYGEGESDIEWVSTPDPIAMYTDFKEPIESILFEVNKQRSILRIVSTLLSPKVFPNIDQLNLLIQKAIGHSFLSQEYNELGHEVINSSNTIEDVSALLCEAIALKSDREINEFNPFDTILVPRFKGQILTQKHINNLRNISFTELGETVKNKRDIKFLFDFMPNGNCEKIFIWLIGNTLYRINSIGTELFHSVYYEAEKLDELSNSYGQIFGLIHEVECYQNTPSECLSLLMNIEKTVTFDCMSIFRGKKISRTTYFPTGLFDNKFEIQNEIEKAYSIYSEVKKIYEHNGGGVINIISEMYTSKILSTLDAKLSQTIEMYLTDVHSLDFNGFYMNCFDYVHLKRLIIDWKNMDETNAVDEYMRLKFSCENDPEHWLIMSYWNEKTSDEITMLSR